MSAPAGLRPRREEGFSLVEVLIAAGILLIVALGILPLFTQSITNNQAGNDYTQATNYAKSEVERLFELPLDNPELTAPVTRVQQFSKVSARWYDEEEFPDGETPAWTRTVTIRQYGVKGLVDANRDGYFDHPLPAGTLKDFIHVKEIDVQVESGRNPLNPLGVGKRVALRTLKAY